MLLGIFSGVLASLDGTGGPLEDAEVFEATVPFGMGRWVIGLKLPFPQALAGVGFLSSVVRKMRKSDWSCVEVRVIAMEGAKSRGG